MTVDSRSVSDAEFTFAALAVGWIWIAGLQDYRIAYLRDRLTNNDTARQMPRRQKGLNGARF